MALLKITVPPGYTIVAGKAQVRAVMRGVGAEVVARARAMIRAGSRKHPSAPGEPPRSVSGKLARSGRARVWKDGEGVTIRFSEFYARFLSLGAKGGGGDTHNKANILLAGQRNWRGKILTYTEPDEGGGDFQKAGPAAASVPRTGARPGHRERPVRPGARRDRERFEISAREEMTRQGGQRHDEESGANMSASHQLAAEARAKLDRILEDYPGASVLLIAVGDGGGVNAFSIPSALSVKRGVIADLYKMTFPE